VGAHRYDVVPVGTTRRDGVELTQTTTQTTHTRLDAWVAEIAELTQPRDIRWITGSDEEWTEITDELVASGTFVRLNEEKKPNSFWAASEVNDVARVEDRTYI
jgi:phosphoenolpyruvate carboxykinase (GTP)